MQDRTSTRLALTLGLVTVSFGAGRLFPIGEVPEAPRSDALTVARDLSTAFRTISDRFGSAVVQVRAMETTSRGWKRSLQDGSGVIVHESGIVITNHHVVRGADEIRAVFASGEVAQAEIVGIDRETDLAVLRLMEGGPFNAAELDDAIEASVGEIVLAMGNPMGLGYTVTQGIVSGTGRTDLNIATYEDFIQTDAVINPGNSGGPLINLEGKIVGINTAVGLESNGDDGIAFAIPSRMVRKVLDDILREGHVVRGFVGIEPYRRFSVAREEQRGYQGISKVKVRSFPDGSPASKAGMLEDDIVLRVADRRIVTVQDFLNIIAENAPGTVVDFVVWRAGRELKIPVELVERD